MLLLSWADDNTGCTRESRPQLDGEPAASVSPAWLTSCLLIEIAKLHPRLAVESVKARSSNGSGLQLIDVV